MAGTKYPPSAAGRRAEHLAGRSLIQTATRPAFAHPVEQPQSPHCHGVGGVVRHVEADPHVALRTQVVDRLGGLGFVIDRTGVVPIPKDQTQTVVGAVRILVNGIDALGVQVR